MRHAVRIYLHRGRERERLSFYDHSAVWGWRLRYFLALGWRVIAVGCESGAAAVHLSLR